MNYEDVKEWQRLTLEIRRDATRLLNDWAAAYKQETGKEINGLGWLEFSGLSDDGTELEFTGEYTHCGGCGTEYYVESLSIAGLYDPTWLAAERTRWRIQTEKAREKAAAEEQERIAEKERKDREKFEELKKRFGQ